MKGGRRSTSYTPTWKSGKTQTIRVPIVLAKQLLEIGRKLDDERCIEVTQTTSLELPKTYDLEATPKQIIEVVKTKATAWEEEDLIDLIDAARLAFYLKRKAENEV